MSQFSRENEHPTLADVPYSFPKEVYPVGRLDHDSEGLLLLTDDKPLMNRLLSPQFAHPRTYWVQVEGEITPQAAAQLAAGVAISINGKSHQTLPADVRIIPEPLLPPRMPPIRFRAAIPTSWLAITLTEGKNRQVRRMTAAVGFPTLRLVRAAIGSYQMLRDMQPNTVIRIRREELL